MVAAPAILDEVRPAVLPRAVLVENHRSFAWISDKICGIIEGPTPRWWWICFGVSCFIASFTVAGLTYLVGTGVGVWGHHSPINWGWPIVNFVFWIGIGHAGTLISAILCLLRQKWRTSINRAAEAMTIFAVVCAGIFPLFHVGRVWMAWYLFPVPNSNGIWQNFRSPLEWDVFAVSTYGTVSVLFWYVGMIPDLGLLRDRFTAAGKKVRAFLYGLFAMGWRGSSRHWSNYEMAYLILAGIATPLVLSVHTIVSFDFAVSLIPGWHTTIFPPYFVAGAIYSGFAMVLTLAIPLRKFYHLEGLVTERHIDNMGKVMLATGFIVAYGYAMEVFMAWYSASHWEAFMMWNRMFGPMGWAYWVLVTCNLAIPLTTLWSRKLRTNIAFMFFISIVVNTGMWFERFVIVVTSLYRDFLPSSWGTYRATKWDYMTYVGTLGLFTALFLLFVRFLPMIPMSEIRTMLPGAKITPKKATEAGD
jgi:molybdopterin-containing oxidoreductase family membrane subunit